MVPLKIIAVSCVRRPSNSLEFFKANQLLCPLHPFHNPYCLLYGPQWCTECASNINTGLAQSRDRCFVCWAIIVSFSIPSHPCLCFYQDITDSLAMKPAWRYRQKTKTPRAGNTPETRHFGKGVLFGMLLTDKSGSPPKHGPERPPDGVHSSLCLTANKPSQYGRRRRFQYLSQGGARMRCQWPNLVVGHRSAASSEPSVLI
ncbi:hypothetical protein CI102_10043 [Trichoderma harzianum]|nr:hypothetical protein CI102_10043 [Trichoderma harzianum]